MKVEFAKQVESDDPPSDLVELIEELKIGIDLPTTTYFSFDR